MTKRGSNEASRILTVMYVVVLLLIVHLSGGLAAEKTEKERKKPPIDLKVPAKVETATFALG